MLDIAAVYVITGDRIQSAVRTRGRCWKTEGGSRGREVGVFIERSEVQNSESDLGLQGSFSQ